MASEQMSRRENKTNEREIRVEQNRVPKMTTHFEHLAEKAKESDVGGNETPQGTIEAVQGLEVSKDHAGKAIGDVGGRGKGRETHGLGAQSESLSDKVRGGDRGEKESDQKARNVDIVGGKEGGGGVRSVGKFQMEDEGGRGTAQELERRTRVVSGKTESGKEKERGRESLGEVVAEKGRGRYKSNEEARGGVPADTEGVTAVITCKFEGGGEQKVPGREAASSTEAEDKTRAKNEQSNMDEISKYRGQAQENANKVISDAQERYQSAKQTASETLSSATQTAKERSAQAKDIAMEKASQAKDATLEKSQQGYASTKDTLASAAKTAAEYTAPVAEKAKDYTFLAAEKAKSAGSTTVNYVGEKAVQAKDVTVETGKTAAGYAGKVAVDLKDKATVAGWTAAHFSAEKTVDVTKAAANVVQGAAGYAGHKAAELAAKSVDTAKGLAAAAGETAKEYTARKKEEAQREYEAKRGAPNQVLDDYSMLVLCA